MSEPRRLEVRPAGPEQAGALARVHAMAFAPANRWDGAAIAQLLAMPGVLALRSGGEAAAPTGFIMLRMAGGEAEILTLAVTPEARRRGIARGLVQAGLAAAVAAGCRSCFLEVAQDNAPARALYAAHGFRQVGRRPGYYRTSPDRTGDGGDGGADALVLRWDAPAAQT